ncbi:General substrate transporter [Rhypophila sp. PSN 637]
MRSWKYNLKGNALLAVITATTCQPFLLLGYDQGAMSGIIGANNAFRRDFSHPNPDMLGNITAIFDIGCVLGSLLCYFIGDKLGRRRMLMLGETVMVLGAVIHASSYSIAQLLVDRVVAGVGTGINSSTAPAFLSECAPASIRGGLLTLQGTVTNLGVVIAFWTAYATSSYDSSFQWRFPLAFQSVFAVLLVFQIIGLPESPRWLVGHDRSIEAGPVIAAIAGKPNDDESVTRTNAAGGPFRFQELFTWGKTQNLRRLILAISVQLGQQFTGSNMINYYTPVIFQSSMGLDRHLALLLGGAAMCTYLVGSIIPGFLMDRYGRRVLLMVCSAGLSLCFVGVTAMLSVGTTSSGYGATAFIFLFQLVRGIGWLPVPWFYPSELATPRIRSQIAAIATAWNWMAIFAVVKFVPIAFANIQWRTFIIFAVLNASFIPIIYFFYPETKGLELEDLPLLFEKGGITGGVFSSKGGRTVQSGQHAWNSSPPVINLDLSGEALHDDKVHDEEGNSVDKEAAGLAV